MIEKMDQCCDKCGQPLVISFSEDEIKTFCDLCDNGERILKMRIIEVAFFWTAPISKKIEAAKREIVRLIK